MLQYMYRQMEDELVDQAMQYVVALRQIDKVRKTTRVKIKSLEDAVDVYTVTLNGIRAYKQQVHDWRVLDAKVRNLTLKGII